MTPVGLAQVLTASLCDRGDATTLKLCRLRYVGSAHDWQFAIDRASRDDYDESAGHRTQRRSRRTLPQNVPLSVQAPHRKPFGPVIYGLIMTEHAPGDSRLAGTYGGNTVACAAALGTVAAEDVAGRARRIGDIMLPRLRELAETYPVLAEVRGRGAMLAIELTSPGTLDPDPATTPADLLDEGLSIVEDAFAAVR